LTIKLHHAILRVLKRDPLFLYIKIKLMEVTIYTTEGCSWCAQMKKLMERANQEYTEILWSSLDDAGKKDILDQYSIQSFPATIIDGVFYTGLVPVAKKFLDEGLVTAPKK